jgi:hypothetical protein
MPVTDLGLTPFGSPDASSDRNPRPCFERTALSAYERLTVRRGDPDARVVVGRMGAGKTRFLIELRERFEEEGGHDLTPMEFELPSLTLITRLAEDLEDDKLERAEIWRRIWRRAIVDAALSRTDPSGSAVPRAIYKEFNRILSAHPKLDELRGYLDDQDWDDTYHAFATAIAARTRPLCFFLDAVEEHSAHSPLSWLWCQTGLVREVLELARDPQLDDKLRIFVAIRDQTWERLMRAESPARLLQHPLVRVLDWDANLMADFLALKVSGLPEGYLFGSNGHDGNVRAAVVGWLGTDCVENVALGCREEVTVYILRHTRLIPRDIVMVGNFLAAEALAAIRRGEPCVSDAAIRRAVARSALSSATEELQRCGAEIVCKQLEHGRPAQASLPDESASVDATRELEELLRGCSHNVFGRDQLEAVARRAETLFGAPVDIATLLWRHGLVGFGGEVEGPFVFSLAAHLPLSRNGPPPAGRYVAMHPSLVDALQVEPHPSVSVPIVPFSTSDIT